MKKFKSLMKALYFTIGFFAGYNLTAVVYDPASGEVANIFGKMIDAQILSLGLSVVFGIIFGLILFHWLFYLSLC